MCPGPDQARSAGVSMSRSDVPVGIVATPVAARRRPRRAVPRARRGAVAHRRRATPRPFAAPADRRTAIGRGRPVIPDFEHRGVRSGRGDGGDQALEDARDDRRHVAGQHDHDVGVGSPRDPPRRRPAGRRTAERRGRPGRRPGPRARIRVPTTTQTSAASRRTASIAWSSKGRPSTGSASLSRPNRDERPPARTMTATDSWVVIGGPTPVAARGPGTWPAAVRRRIPRRSRSSRMAITYLRLVPVASRKAAGVSGRRAGHRGRARREIPIGRGRVGEVRLEDDDPTAPLEFPDAGRRTGRRPGGLGEGRRRRDRQRALEAVHRSQQGRIRRGRERRPGVAGGRRRGPGDRPGPARRARPWHPRRRPLDGRSPPVGSSVATAVRTAASDASDPGASVTAASAAASAASATSTAQGHGVRRRRAPRGDRAAPSGPMPASPAAIASASRADPLDASGADARCPRGGSTSRTAPPTIGSRAARPAQDEAVARGRRRSARPAAGSRSAEPSGRSIASRPLRPTATSTAAVPRWSRARVRSGDGRARRTRSRELATTAGSSVRTSPRWSDASSTPARLSAVRPGPALSTATPVDLHLADADGPVARHEPQRRAAVEPSRREACRSRRPRDP